MPRFQNFDFQDTPCSTIIQTDNSFNSIINSIFDQINNKKLDQIVSKLLTLISRAVLFSFAHVEHFRTSLEDIIDNNYKPLILE